MIHIKDQHGRTIEGYAATEITEAVIRGDAIVKFENVIYFIESVKKDGDTTIIVKSNYDATTKT
jgi:hypothetical protein